MLDTQIIYKSGVVFYGGAPKMPSWAEDRLKGYMDDVGVPALQISSGYRYPEDQARIMLDNILNHGLASQYELYGNNGDRVIDAYAANPSAPRADIIARMAAQIRTLGPEKISRHMATDAIVADIAPSSITGGVDGRLFSALKARMKDAPRDADWRQDPSTIYEIGELLWPPGDPALHFEFPNNSAGLVSVDTGTGRAGTVVKAGILAFVGYNVAKSLWKKRKH